MKNGWIFLNFFIGFLGSGKQSAKGVTKDGRMRLNHHMYKDVLHKVNFVRMINTRIASSNHNITTIVTNKKLLSGYDDNR